MIDDALDRALTNSPFLALLIDRHPALVTLIKAGDFDQALAAALAVEVDGSVAATLRRQRQGVALVTAIADLCGAWDLTRVTRILSDFADTALDRAIEAAIRERYDCVPAGFAVIGLGQHHVEAVGAQVDGGDQGKLFGGSGHAIGSLGKTSALSLRERPPQWLHVNRRWPACRSLSSALSKALIVKLNGQRLSAWTDAGYDGATFLLPSHGDCT